MEFTHNQLSEPLPVLTKISETEMSKPETEPTTSSYVCIFLIPLAIYSFSYLHFSKRLKLCGRRLMHMHFLSQYIVHFVNHSSSLDTLIRLRAMEFPSNLATYLTNLTLPYRFRGDMPCD